MDCNTYLHVYLYYLHRYDLLYKDANVIFLFFKEEIHYSPKIQIYQFAERLSVTLTSFLSQTADLSFSVLYFVVVQGAKGFSYN